MPLECLPIDGVRWRHFKRVGDLVVVDAFADGRDEYVAGWCFLCEGEGGAQVGALVAG